MKQNHSTGLFYKSDESPDIIGKTDSGKQVLGGNAEVYSKDFDSEDHRNAKAIHEAKVTKLHTRARMSMLQSGKFNHKLLSSLSESASHHTEQVDYHHEQAEAEVSTPAPQSEGVEKSCQVGTILSKADIALLSDASIDEQNDRSVTDEGLSKGRGKDKQKRKTKGALPGQDAPLSPTGRFGGYDASVLGQHKEGPQGRDKPSTPPAPTRTIQEHELPPTHYSKPNNAKYRTILSALGDRAEGSITYNHHTDTIHTLGDAGNKLMTDLKAKHSKKGE